MAEKALQIAVKRREAKIKGEKERYKHLNKERQESLPQQSMHRNRGKQQNGKD